jgi:hypothetical protein
MHVYWRSGAAAYKAETEVFERNRDTPSEDLTPELNSLGRHGARSHRRLARGPTAPDDDDDEFYSEE